MALLKEIASFNVMVPVLPSLLHALFHTARARWHGLIILQAVKSAGCLLSVPLVDTVGRRPLLIAGAAVGCISWGSLLAILARFGSTRLTIDVQLGKAAMALVSLAVVGQSVLLCLVTVCVWQAPHAKYCCENCCENCTLQPHGAFFAVLLPGPAGLSKEPHCRMLTVCTTYTDTQSICDMSHMFAASACRGSVNKQMLRLECDAVLQCAVLAAVFPWDVLAHPISDNVCRGPYVASAACCLGSMHGGMAGDAAADASGVGCHGMCGQLQDAAPAFWGGRVESVVCCVPAAGDESGGQLGRHPARAYYDNAMSARKSVAMWSVTLGTDGCHMLPAVRSFEHECLARLAETGFGFRQDPCRHMQGICCAAIQLGCTCTAHHKCLQLLDTVLTVFSVIPYACQIGSTYPWITLLPLLLAGTPVKHRHSLAAALAVGPLVPS